MVGQIGGGRYELVQEIATGGMGTVWQGHDTLLDRPVAIKQVSLGLVPPVQQAEFLQRAVQEGRNAAALADHPNIVTVYDVVVEDGAPWTVMQLVRGRSLAGALEDGPLAVDAVSELAGQMLSALGFAHEAGIVHRDVKPLNIMVGDGDGGDASLHALLMDFGIAKSDADTGLTRTGFVVGSAPYMAPERHEGEPGGPPSDLFSLGVTLFEAVEGYPPFAKDTRTGTVTALLIKPLPPMTRAGRLAPLISALTAKDPAERPTVAEALRLCDGSAHARPGARNSVTAQGSDTISAAASVPRGDTATVTAVPASGVDGSWQRAVVALETAEQIAAGLGDDGVPLLAEVAEAWALADPAQASRLLNQVEHILAGITRDKLTLAWARAATAKAWATVDPARAERVAVDIADKLSPPKVWALAAVGEKRATIDPAQARRLLTQAKHLAGRETDSQRKATLLADVANAWAAVDHEVAGRLFAQAEAVAVHISSEHNGASQHLSLGMRLLFERHAALDSAQSLAEVAERWAAVELPQAVRLLERAERIAARNKADDVKLRVVLQYVADAWAAVASAGIDRFPAKIGRKRWKPPMRAVAVGWARTDPARAERAAATIEEGSQRARALVAVAEGWAAIDPSRAEQVAAGITDEIREAEALIKIARVWFATGTGSSPPSAAP